MTSAFKPKKKKLPIFGQHSPQFWQFFLLLQTRPRELTGSQGVKWSQWGYKRAMGVKYATSMIQVVFIYASTMLQV